jgi:hypothetical protein
MSMCLLCVPAMHDPPAPQPAYFAVRIFRIPCAAEQSASHPSSGDPDGLVEANESHHQVTTVRYPVNPQLTGKVY